MKQLFSKIPLIHSGTLELKQLTVSDADGLSELVDDPVVYRYLPTFLFERKYNVPAVIVERLYDECLEESLILGIYTEGVFCGLAEFYGYRGEIHKISVGYRLLRKFWGRGIATKVLSMMMDYLLYETDIEIITASTMIENKASAGVLKNNGFTLVVHGSTEDWGYPEPTIVDKWIR